MDALLDLWINTVYNDEQVQGSDVGPVVYLRNGTGNPLLGYAELAQRWGVSKATAGRYVRKLIALDYISAVSFAGTHGTALYLKNYLSTMFQISDILVDKDEVAMALNLSVPVDEYLRLRFLAAGGSGSAAGRFSPFQRRRGLRTRPAGRKPVEAHRGRPGGIPEPSRSRIPGHDRSLIHDDGRPQRQFGGFRRLF